MKTNIDIENNILQTSNAIGNENTTLIPYESNKNINDEKNNLLTQRKLGNMKCYYYKNGNPLIAIGPHCKIK
jgi:hypothetical protein